MFVHSFMYQLCLLSAYELPLALYLLSPANVLTTFLLYLSHAPYLVSWKWAFITVLPWTPFSVLLALGSFIYTLEAT